MTVRRHLQFAQNYLHSAIAELGQLRQGAKIETCDLIDMIIGMNENMFWASHVASRPNSSKRFSTKYYRLYEGLVPSFQRMYVEGVRDHYLNNGQINYDVLETEFGVIDEKLMALLD